MIKKIILYLILLPSIFVEVSSAQEVVLGLQSNYLISGAAAKKAKSSTASFQDTIQLPVFDDFSGQSVFPDTRVWIDDYVFINNTLSDKQITAGVATFDALDNKGWLYETAISSGFKADQLTSRPINLNYTSADNLWLSFLYQAGGLGDSPEPKDSLTLQFLAPGENKWYSIWRAEGDTIQRFKQAIMKIDDPRFLKKGFQFRFINYASLSPNASDPSLVGNCDQWNIDYVLLDKNRDEGDTIYADVAFTLPLRSLLKSHEAMPWKQFRQVYLQEMGSAIPVHYRNNDTIIRNVTRNFEIWDVYRNSQSHFFSSGASNIDPSTNINYNANLIYTFDTDNIDSALFRITATLKTDEFDPKRNDTMVYYQRFKNYFAFDDGSAEAGYGINGLGSRNAMVACRFVSYMPDTLRAISICFNDSYLESNKRAFDLEVWDDNNGFPGNILGTVEEVMVEQSRTINGFYTYKVPGKIPVNGVFYVGWKQRSESFLNAGLDVNTPNLGRQLYWLNGEWTQSQVHGSLMIRAVTGDAQKVTGINDVIYQNKNMIKIWPNPAGNYINIDASDLMMTGSAYLTITDLYGRELKRLPLSEYIDISYLPAGAYIIITSINGKAAGYSRLIKAR